MRNHLSQVGRTCSKDLPRFTNVFYALRISFDFARKRFFILVSSWLFVYLVRLRREKKNKKILNEITSRLLHRLRLRFAEISPTFDPR